MSSIVIVGTVGSDPETKFVGQDGKALTTFSVAVNNYKGKDKEETTTWFRVNAWTHLSDGAASVAKGYRVIVQGRLEIEEYVDKEGQKRSSNVVTADEIGVSTRWHDVTATKRSKDGSPKGGQRMVVPEHDDPF